MKRNRSRSIIRNYLLPAFAAIVLAAGVVACSTTGEGEPTAALDGAASGEAAANGNAANGNTVAGENANASTEGANTAKPEGEAAASNNPIGNELNNAIGGEGNAGGNQAAVANNAGNGAADNGGATDPGALNADGAGNALNAAAMDNAGAGATDPALNAGAADANTSDPFAPGANAAPAPGANAAPMAGAADSAYGNAAAPATPDAGGATSPAPATTSAGTAGADEDGDDAASEVVSGPTSLPEMGAKLAYYVMRGDTLGGIAQKIYGSRARWKSLQTENGLADANKIYPGDVIYYTLTEASKAFAEKYEKANRQTYTVSKGDTLSAIAAKFYGTQGAWRVLWKENPQVTNPDRIRVGMVLTYRTENKVALKDDEEGELEVTGGAPEGDDEANDAFDLLTASLD